MKVDRLVLKNFRNIQEATLYPDPSINFLTGANGQGKTSFLEALGFLATLRSFRESKTAQVIQWGAQASEISCQVSAEDPSHGDWKTDLKLSFYLSDAKHQKATKNAYVNEKLFRSSTLYLSQRFGTYEMGFHAIIFNPADHDLVRGEPSQRRAYLDRVIAAEDLEYLQILQKYKRILEQRNALLRDPERCKPQFLQGFTEPLCHYAARLTLKRLSWILRTDSPLRSILQRIAPSQPELRLVYLSNWVPFLDNLSYKNSNLNSVHFTGQGHLPSLELLEQAFWTQTVTLESAELKAGHSLVGPHRDDWCFLLGGQLLKGHGSQGEVRSALLALKLAEIILFREKTQHRPIFLLDDFSSELDRDRRWFLLDYLRETDLQTFVTTTEDLTYVGKRYWVNQGTIEEGRHDDRTEAV